jgi:hypothetical protein
MSLKLNIGLSKKVGQPDYGSLCASCHIECELDTTLPATDLKSLHEHVRETFLVCSQAVHEELARQQNAAESIATGDQHILVSRNGKGMRASIKQLEYAQKLANDIQAVNVRRLESLAAKMFSKRLAELTRLDASALIDTLKDIKAGKVDAIAPKA